jgi:hypothetical protein
MPPCHLYPCEGAKVAQGAGSERRISDGINLQLLIADPTVIVDLGSIPDQMKKNFCRENVGPVEIDVQASSFDIDLSRRPAHLCAASS